MPLTRLFLRDFRSYPELRLAPAPGFVCLLGDFGAGKTEWLSVLWLTPTMDRLFAGIAGDRHRFLDRLVLVLALEPGHAHHAACHKAAMRVRNKLPVKERGQREYSIQTSISSGPFVLCFGSVPASAGW